MKCQELLSQLQPRQWNWEISLHPLPHVAEEGFPHMAICMEDTYIREELPVEEKKEQFLWMENKSD